MCPVLTFELYLSKLSPEVDILWQRPMTQPVSRSTPIWFTAHTLSKNYMRHFMATLSKSASLTRIYTSNSIPQTPVSALDEAYFYRESRVPVEAIVQKSPPKPRAPRRNSKAQGGGSSSVHAGAVAGGVMPSLPSPSPLPVGMVGLPSIASIKAEQQAQQVQQVQVLKTQQSLHVSHLYNWFGINIFIWWGLYNSWSYFIATVTSNCSPFSVSKSQYIIDFKTAISSEIDKILSISDINRMCTRINNL